MSTPWQFTGNIMLYSDHLCRHFLKRCIFMKILQFTQNHVAMINEKAKTRNAGQNKDFAKILNQISKPAVSGNSGTAVSMENIRASQIPPLADLGTAGLLLGRLNSNIMSSSPEALGNVHSLNSLVQVYGK